MVHIIHSRIPISSIVTQALLPSINDARRRPCRIDGNEQNTIKQDADGWRCQRRTWGRGGYIVSSLHISYEDVLHRRSSGWRHSVVNDYRRKRLFDGVYDYVVKSFQSTRDDEAVARGRDLTIDEHSLIVFNLCRIFGDEILAAIRWFGTNPFRRHQGQGQQQR